MGEKKSANIQVLCPCCGATLSIDSELHKVISHDPPRKQAPSVDLDRAAEMLKEQEARREALFQQSAEDMKTRAQVLDRKFEAALEKSKDEPVTKPTRDIDLD